jgi:O-antigen/teichoic acid export membrane protein
MRSPAAIARSAAGRNSAGSLVVQGSQRLARIGTIVVSAAVLDPVAFASLAVALALTDLIRSALLAYDVSAVRMLAAGHPVREVLGSHLASKLIVGLVGTLLVVGFSIVAYEPGTTWLVVIASLGTIPVGVSSLLLARRQVAFQLGSAAPRAAVGSAAGTSLAIVGLLVTRQPEAVSAGLAAGDILVLALLSGGLREAGGTAPREIIRVIRGAVTLLIMQLAYIAQFRVGTVVLGAVGAVVAVGEYTVASRIAEGLVIFAAAVTASSLPLMGGFHSQGDIGGLERTVRRSYRLSLLAAAPVIAILAISGPLWVQLLFPRYPGAAAVYIPVGLTVVVYFASSQTSAFLNASHRDRIAAASAVVGVLAAIAGSWWLVALGAFGVAVARLGGEVLRLAIETAAMARFAQVLTRSMPGAWLAVTPFLLVAIGVLIASWAPASIVIGTVVTVGWALWLVRRGWIWTAR